MGSLGLSKNNPNMIYDLARNIQHVLNGLDWLQLFVTGGIISLYQLTYAIGGINCWTLEVSMSFIGC